MLAVLATDTDPDDPLAGLAVGQHPEPSAQAGWVTVRVRAASINHHDLWTLRGVGIDPSRLPIVLGCDAAGVTDDGREVIVHTVVSPSGTSNELLDPKVSLLSEHHDGTFAEYVTVPARNVIDKPPELSFEEAGCLSTAYLTAYRALFVQAGLRPGGRLLIQGAGGGVSTAAILLGKAGGLRVYVTSREEQRRERALALGADAALESGARLPERVDAVLESVGEATWEHSLRALEPGGVVVVIGATSGHEPAIDLRRVFYRQVRIVGSLMGTRDELEALARMLVATGVRPLIDTALPLERAPEAFARLHSGDVFGKLVFQIPS